MLTLAALALSLATSTAPALNDPGAAPANLAAAPIAIAQMQVAQGHAELGPAEPSAADAAIAGLLAAKSHISDAATVGTQNIGMANIGAANIGIPTIPESGHGFPVGPILPMLGFALCGGLALVFARKKQQATPKMLEIVETHGLGGRRSLIVARIAGETVLLGASEAGLTLLLARPGETVSQQEPLLANLPRAEEAKPKRPPSLPSVLTTSWLGRLRLARQEQEQHEKAEPEPSFEELLARDAAARAQTQKTRAPANVEPALLRQPIDPLAESAEDTELRRKLAQGRSGRIA